MLGSGAQNSGTRAALAARKFFFSQALAVPCVSIPELEQATARLLPLPGAVDREDEQSKEEETKEGGEEINPGNMIDGV